MKIANCRGNQVSVTYRCLGSNCSAALTKDFVVPQMALENIDVREGWPRLRSMIKADKAGYAGYVGFKILLSIGAG